MASAGTVSTGLTIPSSSRTIAPFHLGAASLCPRFTNPSLAHSHPLTSLQTQHAPIIAKTEGSVGHIHGTHAAAATTDYAEEGAAAEHTDGDGKEEWEVELLNELNPLIYLHPRRQRKAKQQKETLHAANQILNPVAGVPDWAERARQRALDALEARNPAAVSYLKQKIEPTEKKQRKKKKRKSPQSILPHKSGGLETAKTKITLEKFEEALRLEDKGSAIATNEADAQIVREDVEVHESLITANDDFNLDDIENIDDLPLGNNDEFEEWNTSKTSNVLLLAIEDEKGSERERIFNKRLVGAKAAQEVLDIVGDAVERIRALGSPSLLTPLNAATALHRIAKHIEMSGTPKSDRLDFSRKRYMAELVARSMEVLEGCSAQGLSNIAWALSKIGGSSLYSAEMDLVANAVLQKVPEFNSQNVANTLGAYSSMQHSAPRVFASLCERAVDILEQFSSQELAQVLWAHAELTQPADPLLDALDNICLLSERGLLKSLIESDSTSGCNHIVSSMPSTGNLNPFCNFSADHLVNLGWSYAVLNQANRPSFKCLWKMLQFTLDQNADKVGDNSGALSSWHLSQIHQVNLCLQYGYPQYASTLKVLMKDAAAQAWESQKAKIWSPSEYQNDVKWHLVSLGQDWVSEYTAADYSLDLARPEEKMAIEIDGPSHFIRNTGSPLGHTILKRRILSQAGWRVLSISYVAWEELDGETEQMSFLKELLRTGV